MYRVNPEELLEWCRIPYQELEDHPNLKVPFRLCKDSSAMGDIMARELVDMIKARNEAGRVTRAILPCGPRCWYKPFTDLVNKERVSLRQLVVFHMDESLDWQGRELPPGHPLNFRTFMKRYFYEPVDDELSVPVENRKWLRPGNVDEIREEIDSVSIDATYGGWGQDGHIAYNQAQRDPFCSVSVDDFWNSSVRIQANSPDLTLAMAQRYFGTACQFVPPMSVTLGLKECLSARRVRLFSDTGAWKQTALRVALFGPLTPEYPITLVQEHPDALLTATIETASHPISEHPEWELI